MSIYSVTRIFKAVQIALMRSRKDFQRKQSERICTRIERCWNLKVVENDIERQWKTLKDIERRWKSLTITKTGTKKETDRGKSENFTNVSSIEFRWNPLCYTYIYILLHSDHCPKSVQISRTSKICAESGFQAKPWHLRDHTEKIRRTSYVRWWTRWWTKDNRENWRRPPMNLPIQIFWKSQSCWAQA